MNEIGVNTWVWVSPATDDRIAELAPRIAGWGFDGLELPIEDVRDWNPARVGEILSEAGLTVLSTCAAMAPGRELVAADADTVEAAQEYIRACIDVTADAGAHALIGPIYAAVGRTWKIEDRGALVRELAENLKPLAEHAGERGIRLGIEPLNRFETSVLNTAEQVLEVVEAVGSEACGVMLDTFHMNIEEKDPVAALRAAADELVHLQISGSDRGAPGHDHIDWDAIGGAIREIGYAGPLTIESFTVENESIAKAAAIWRPLEPSQDDIARVGIQTLRRVLGAA